MPNVSQLRQMSHTFTIRITDELLAWLKETSRRTGMPVGQIIREQLDRAKTNDGKQPFLRHLGAISGAEDSKGNERHCCYGIHRRRG
jgi:Ribbon-helix-helix domain